MTLDTHATPAAPGTPAKDGTSAKPRRVLIVVENLPVPLDRRVWLAAYARVFAKNTAK